MGARRTQSVADGRAEGEGRPRPGVRLLHKRAGVTSHSLVREVQQMLDAAPGRAWKLCHAGALDPFATGLLPILIGSATRLFERVHELPKTYEATVVFGTETDTCDGGGAVVSTGDAGSLTALQLDAALGSFLGWTKQVPPATSNKRVGGERAYQKAHRGELVELPAADVFLHRAEWVRHALPASSVMRLTCRGGFYVRSLARDLGRKLGCSAHLSTLTRTQIGPWLDPGEGVVTTLAGLDAVPWLPTVALHDDEWGRLKPGEGVVSIRAKPTAPRWRPAAGFPPPSPLVVATHLGRVVALLEARPGGYAMHTALLPPF
ncbi:MAG: tRNA pseudouridine(55) synthase TruB [Myxococcaceae bacterium]|nr:tRNA pseudouridine(55) synthase TruB [Myxococcaceae bacterium]